MEFIPEQSCEKCGTKLDAVTMHDRTNELPVSGDFSVCAYCGEIGRFDEELIIRPWTEEDKENIKKEHPDLYTNLIQSQMAIKHMRNDNIKPANF